MPEFCNLTVAGTPCDNHNLWRGRLEAPSGCQLRLATESNTCRCRPCTGRGLARWRPIMNCGQGADALLNRLVFFARRPVAGRPFTPW